MNKWIFLVACKQKFQSFFEQEKQREKKTPRNCCIKTSSSVSVPFNYTTTLAQAFFWSTLPFFFCLFWPQKKKRNKLLFFVWKNLMVCNALFTQREFNFQLKKMKRVYFCFKKCSGHFFQKFLYGSEKYLRKFCLSSFTFDSQWLFLFKSLQNFED